MVGAVRGCPAKKVLSLLEASSLPSYLEILFFSHGGRRLRSGEARKTSAAEGPKAGPRRGFSATPLFFVTFRDLRANGRVERLEERDIGILARFLLKAGGPPGESLFPGGWIEGPPAVPRRREPLSSQGGAMLEIVNGKGKKTFNAFLCGNVVEIDEAEKIARLYVFADEGRKRLKETARILSDRHGCRVEKIVDVLEYAPEIKECGIEIFMQGETADLREKAYGMFLRFQGVPKMFFHLYSFETNVETDSEDIEISNIDINNFLEVVYFYVDFFRTLLKDITVCRKFKNHFNSLCRNPNFDLYEMYMNRDELLEFFSMPEISLDASYGYSKRRLNRCCSRVRKLARDFGRLLETVGDFLPEVYVVGVPSGRRGSPPLVRFVFEMGESDEEDARAGGSKRTVSFVWATAIGVDGCSMAFLSHADDFEIVTHLLLSFGMYDELVSSFRKHFVAVSRSSFRVVSSA